MTSFIVGWLVVSLLLAGIVGTAVFIVRRLTPPRCRHDWDLRVTLYKKPLIPKAFESYRYSASDYLKVIEKHESLMIGETLVIFSCKGCGFVREKVYPGIVKEPDLSRKEPIGRE